MPDKILLQRDRLTVTESKLIVGGKTTSYPDITELSIYDGRPLLPAARIATGGLIPLGILLCMGTQVFGELLPLKAVGYLMLPLLAMFGFGFFYRVRCLFATVDGQAVTVLKSSDAGVLEHVKGVIESAKRVNESNPSPISDVATEKRVPPNPGVLRPAL